MWDRRSIRKLAFAAPLLFLSASLTAQGSGVYTHSGCMTGRAGAGIANPCADGSAIFYNPAALAVHGSVVGLGATAIRSGGSFEYDGTGVIVDRETETAMVPHGWLSLRATDRFAVGIGVWLPYGLGTRWPDSFEGSFVGYDNSLQSVYVQPTLAYQLIPGFLSIGAGVDVVRGSVAIRQRLDLAQQVAIGNVTFGQLGVPSGTAFADADLEGSGTGVAWHVGLLAETPRFSAGWRYMHRARVEMDGTAVFQQVPTGIQLPADNPLGLPGGTPLDAVVGPQFADGAPLSDQPITSRITFPAQFVAGVKLQATRNLAILADYQWTGWRSFDEVPLGFERAPDQVLILDYRDATTLRIGAELDAFEPLSLRAAWIYNTAATPDETVTPLLPEAERMYLAAGIGYDLSDRLSIDAAFQYIFQEDRRGRVRPRPSREDPAEALNVGEFSGTGQLFGATLSYRFGPDRSRGADRTMR